MILRFPCYSSGVFFFGGLQNNKPQIGVRFRMSCGDEKSNDQQIGDLSRPSSEIPMGGKHCRLETQVVYGTCDVFMANMAFGTNKYNTWPHGLITTYMENYKELLEVMKLKVFKGVFLFLPTTGNIFSLRHTESSERHGLLGGLFWLHLNSYPHTGNIWIYSSVIKIKRIQFQCSHHPSVLPKVIQRNIMNIVLCCAQTGGIQHQNFSKIVPEKGR